ncbi:sensor histidine kinase [Streptomyces boluensis]|uniref:sensor histidine kinase n=1 Tax=Streptomyces boluensis TaxID=1775135 RepID=UPI001652AF34|nr:nitrate- and nitrite sensing domain-containing protein [Streptomyces boluensis]
MRAPVQKKRPRGKGGKETTRPANTEGAAPEARSDTPEGPVTAERPQSAAAPAGRPKRVRNRLIVAVAVVAATVAGAGTPGITDSSAQLAESQRLVTLAELTKNAVSLAHSLADERDEVTSYIATGRPDDKPVDGLAQGRGGRVDRRIKEVRAEANGELRRDLDALAQVRRAAVTGKGSALETHTAYTKAIAELHALVEHLAEQLPPRAGSGARALADLDRAVEQAGATRGLLLAALATPRDRAPGMDPVTGRPTAGTSANSRSRNALAAAAQQSRVSEQAALSDFERAAPGTDRAKLGSTVTGPEVVTAERYLARLTDQPTLSAAELRYDRERVGAALSARVEQLRSVENTLAADRVESLSRLRDDDVTALEVRIALVGVLLLLAVGIATAVARTLTRPLAVLRLGSARLADAQAAEEPIRFTGRNDEFAAVVRSVNTLHAQAQRLQDRLTVLEGDRKHLVGQREKLADEREELRDQLDEVLGQVTGAGGEADGTVVQLALRALAVVERQLGVIEGLEEREQDPDRLGTLFKLDHFATVMRRHSENLLVLAGAEHRGDHAGPVPLIDVLRAAVSEIDQYDRVRIASLPPHAHLEGSAADDISHLVAELLENATSFSPPDAAVEISGWLLENGEAMLSVRDEGIGIGDERLRELNAGLAEFDPERPYEPVVAADGEEPDGLGLGLYVVARLAARHGLRVELREQQQGGLEAVVVLPQPVLAAAPAAAVAAQSGATVPGQAPEVHLPGAEAEANSNVLQGSLDPSSDEPQGDDPYIRAAERAFAEADPEVAPEADDTDEPADALDTEPADALDSEPVTEPDIEHDSVLDDAEPQPDAEADAELDDDSEADSEADEDSEPEAEHEPDADAEADRELPGVEADLGTLGAEADVDALDVLDADDPHPFVPEPLLAPATESVSAPEPDDTHERVDDGVPRTPPQVQREHITDTGLPKRTPKATGAAPAPAPLRSSVDPEALRERLGKFHQGAKSGRLDVQAELDDADAEQGDPAEEARS